MYTTEIKCLFILFQALFLLPGIYRSIVIPAGSCQNIPCSNFKSRIVNKPARLRWKKKVKPEKNCVPVSTRSFAETEISVLELLYKRNMVLKVNNSLQWNLRSVSKLPPHCFAFFSEQCTR